MHSDHNYCQTAVCRRRREPDDDHRDSLLLDESTDDPGIPDHECDHNYGQSAAGGRCVNEGLQPMDESSLVQDVPSEIPQASGSDEIGLPVSYTFMKGASQRNVCKLFDSLGFNYVVNKSTATARYWRCSVRSTKCKCLASVRESEGEFTRGARDHNHMPVLGSDTVAQVFRKIKKDACKDLYKPAGRIAEEAVCKYVSDQPCEKLPNLTELARIANRKRAKLRPAEPKTSDFELNVEYLPREFLKGDIAVANRRHILLATDNMLSLLCDAKTWYMDGTFNIVKKPFVQLYSIHVFVRHDDNIKQVPVAFFIMSGRSKRDYKVVFRQLLDVLPRAASVKNIVMDFEQAVWRAARKVFPACRLKGCAFHWCQAVFRKIQEFGLHLAYTNIDSVHKLCRKIMALPLLPSTCIATTFLALRRECDVNETIKRVCDYVDNTWISNNLWKPDSWSVYGQSVRTNNDVEGWHQRINVRAQKANLSFYVLVTLLHEESQIVNIQVRLLSDKKLKRMHRKKYEHVQGRLFRLWERYEKSEITAKQLLFSCSRVYGPCVNK